MSDESKVYALNNIKHDGKGYVRGDMVPVQGDALKTLLRIGVVSTEPVVDEKPAENRDLVVSKGDKGSTKKEDDASEESEGDKYDAMSQADLKAELKARNLSVSGKVDELRARLREDDASEESDE